MKKHLPLYLSLLLAAVSAPIRVWPQQIQAQPTLPPSVQLAVLADDYWQTQMRLSPLYATFVGYGKYDDLLDDPGAAGRAEDHRQYTRLLKTLHGLPRWGYNDAEKTTMSVMEYELQRHLDAEKYKFWEYNVDHMEGPQSWILTVVETSQPMKTEEDAQNLILRMKAVPSYFAGYIANLREGLRDGRVAARVPVDKTIAQLDELLAVPADSTTFADAGRKLPSDLQAAYMPQIVAAVDTHIKPSLKEFHDFLQNEYLRKARTDKIGLSALPDGANAYKYMVRYHTTLEMTPEAIHALGIEQLTDIHAEMEAIARHMRFKGDLKAFLAHVRQDPKNYFKTREEIVAAAKDRIGSTYAKLPLWFGLLPKTPLVVKPFEEYREKNEVDAQYFPPSDDFSRPGVYYINTYLPETRARFHMGTLAAHEGIPGHHLQIALSMEIPGLPTFRRHGDYNAFVEGWALYSERLADEMGLYKDDLTRLGMLSGQAWRACRLVVDTGIHAMGWSRQQAIDFMKENTAMSDQEVANEVDRYTIWPGQALAYKIGQREILDLRAKSKAALGKKFDIKKFHDDVLRNGAVPLSVLRQAIQESIQEQTSPAGKQKD
jgi:uncharacterized protein (DUF885 family)